MVLSITSLVEASHLPASKELGTELQEVQAQQPSQGLVMDFRGKHQTNNTDQSDRTTGDCTSAPRHNHLVGVTTL